MEKSMFKRFTMGQNFRVMMRSNELPSAVHELIPAYQKIFKSDSRGTLINDSLIFDKTLGDNGSDEVAWEPVQEQRLSARNRKLLSQWIAENNGSKSTSSGELQSIHNQTPRRALMRSQIEIWGQTFIPDDSDISKRNCNSMVAYCPRQRPSPNWSAGEIHEILSIRLQETGKNKSPQVLTFLIVHEYIALSETDAKFDNYRRFPPLGGRLFYREVNARPILVPIDDVLGHFGYIKQSKFPGIERECLLSIPLFKVSLFNSLTQARPILIYNSEQW